MRTVVTILLAAAVVRAADPVVDPAATAELTVRAVDEDGRPVPGVQISTSVFERNDRRRGGFGQNVNRLTLFPTDGAAVARVVLPCLDGVIHYGVKDMPGLYSSHGCEYRFRRVVGGKWQPENPAVDILVRRVVKPIPLQVIRIPDRLDKNRVELPALGQAVGFDLDAQSLVQPHGRGTRADLFFTLQGKRMVPHGYDFVLKVSFPNPGDGIQVQQVHYPKCDFPDVREAPLGGYAREMSHRLWIGVSREGFPTRFGGRDDPAAPKGYLLRLRTVLGPDGKVESAVYAKVQGLFGFYPPKENQPAPMEFVILLNPTPNDRNLEWDRSEPAPVRPGLR